MHFKYYVDSLTKSVFDISSVELLGCYFGPFYSEPLGKRFEAVLDCPQFNLVEKLPRFLGICRFTLKPVIVLWLLIY